MSSSGEQDDKFDVKFDEDIAIIMIGSDENRIDFKFLEKMHAALDTVLKNSSVRAVVTTGQGRFYSNGINLSSFSDSDSQTIIKFQRSYSQMLARILTFPLVTVAAINGHAYAGGAILSLAHDHVIMQTKKGWWCLNEVHINLRIPEHIINLLRNKLSSAQTFHEVLVLGKRFGADEAHRAGIVNEICAPDDLIPRAFSWIRTSLPKSGYERTHLQQMKKDAYKGLFESLEGASSKL